MDLNDLYHRHGVSLLRARHAACTRSRDAHRTMAASYARRIATELRTGRSASA